MKCSRSHLLLATAALACSDTPSSPPGSGSNGEPSHEFNVEATLAFDDPPLEGAIRIVPSSKATNWQFSVDVDDDGNPDEIGFVDEGVSIFYQFDEIGTHRIRTTIERGDERLTFDNLVNVNDPSAVRTLARVPIDHRAIAISSHTGSLYVGTDTELLEIDESTRATERALGLDSEVVLLSVAPDGSHVVVGLEGSLLLVEPNGFTVAKRLVVTDARPLSLLALGRGRLIVGLFNGMLLVDTESGEILNRIDIVARHLALSADERTMVVSEFNSTTAAVRLMDPVSLETLWVTSFDPDIVQPAAISFSPNNRRVFLLDRGAERRLLVLDAATGRVLRNVIVGDRCGLQRCQEAFFNPSSSLFGDRFVVFPTDVGAYFVDTREDFRIVRFNTDENSRRGCCSVTQSSDGTRLFILSDVFIDVVDVQGR